MAQSQSLPGMENREIKDLQEKAIDYAKVRDKRQKLTLQEVELKGDLLKLMKKHKKEEYEYGDVKVTVVTEEETVKVKIKKKEDEERPD